MVESLRKILQDETRAPQFLTAVAMGVLFGGMTVLAIAIFLFR